MLVTKLLGQGYKRKRLKSAFLKFCREYNNLLSKYAVDFAHHINMVLA